MLWVLDVAGVVCLLQGISPLAQKAAGQDPDQSFFIVNQLSQYQPLGSIALIALGILLLVLSQGIRKARK
ncbi:MULTISPECIES: hypothetical protein [Streptomyces]|uniref:Uncharacterized protein n=2 Tax=Streptomyces TaxID=1883 RepID=A0A3R7FVN9_9ACTN|nr:MULTISPECIES: hypothetical protein [Streptomyces]KNE81930.1 hypothetical protein ADZ36_13635 [Streptomyces fradiae]OFA51561.1 hypothetical protein BEN35_13425 [Streptomyces fradiae]PQM19429.1 hypothetical protein Sfr7A_32380 [Streptomyces xinghaiensis]RKM95952.1 hypothetical protein SFRA_013165 [Streptomyces xinghaiensis]RNC69908.1 hypothetical protein DC095_027050 [Streptomyces xinghaiensis]